MQSMVADTVIKNTGTSQMSDGVCNNQKPTVNIDMTILRPVMQELEKELTSVLEKYYAISPYKKWEMSFNVETYAYSLHVGLLPNPHLNTLYLGDSPTSS